MGYAYFWPGSGLILRVVIRNCINSCCLWSFSYTGLLEVSSILNVVILHHGTLLTSTSSYIGVMAYYKCGFLISFNKNLFIDNYTHWNTWCFYHCSLGVDGVLILPFLGCNDFGLWPHCVSWVHILKCQLQLYRYLYNNACIYFCHCRLANIV